MDFWELVVLFEKAGFVDPKYYPGVYAAVELWRENEIPSELEMIIEFEPGLVHEAAMRVEGNAFAPPVSSVEAQLLAGEYEVGTVNEFGDKFFLNKKDFCLGVLILGSPGSGKSHLICGLADQMLRLPPAQRGFNILFVQWGKDDAGSLSLKYPWLHCIDLKDLPYNPMMVQSWETVDERLEAFLDMFSSENYLKTLSRPILGYGLESAYRDFGVFDGSKKYPTFRDLDPFLDRYIEENKLKGYNPRDARDRTKNVVYPFKKYGRLNDRRGLEAPDFLSMDLCVNVGNTNPTVAVTVLSCILDDERRYLMKHPPAPGVDLKSLVIFDEARKVFKSEKSYLDFGGGGGVQDWDTKRRSAKIGRIAGSQEPQSVPEYVASNSSIQFLFQQTGEGIHQGARNLYLSDDQILALLGLPRPGHTLVRETRIGRPFVCVIRPESGILPNVSPVDVVNHNRLDVDSLHAVFDKLNDEGVEVSAEARDKAGLSKDERKVLGVLAGNPFLNKSDLRDATLLFDKLGGVVDVLKNRGFLFEKVCIGKTRNATYFPLLKKAHDSLRLVRGQRVDPKLFEHSLCMFWVASWLKRQGLRARPEHMRAGVKGRIDVYCMDTNTAYEVQRNVKNVFSNVQKCFDDFCVDRLVFVCETKAMSQQCQKQVERVAPKEYLKKLKKKVDYVLIRSMI